MGTTLDTLKAGSTSFVFVMAVEGYNKLITSGSPSAALTAWAGDDWFNCIGGLSVAFKQSQKLDPDNPFPTAGSITVAVMPDQEFAVGDTFGVDVFRKDAGAEGYLRLSITRNSTTIRGTSVASFPTSGEAHIGVECFSYTSVIGDNFLNCTRGLYSPFKTSSTSLNYSVNAGRFSHTHRVEQDTLSINLQPVISQQPRVWNGRRVGIWAHRVVGGVLDVKAQAECIFAGRIADIRDDPNAMATTVELEHVSTEIAEATVADTLWLGEVSGTGGVYLAAGAKFDWADLVIPSGGFASEGDAAPLVVVSGTPANSHQIKQGYWTLPDLCARITAWITGESMVGDYAISVVSDLTTGAQSVALRWSLGVPTTPSTTFWAFTMPRIAATAFGWTPDGSADETYPSDHVYVSVKGPARTGQTYGQFSGSAAGTVIVADGGPGARCQIGATVSGTLVAQEDGSLPPSTWTLPSAVSGYPGILGGLAERVGLFVVNDEAYVRAFWQTSTPTEFYNIQRVFVAPNDVASANEPIIKDINDASPLQFRQIFAFEGGFASLVRSFLSSSGSIGFNDPITDTLPIGVGLPYDLIKGVVDTVPITGPLTPVFTIIEKATRLDELFRSDFILRWCYLFWASGSMRFGSWYAPTGAGATETLDETNKAEPSGSPTPHYSASSQSEQWLRSVVKIEYNRDATKISSSDTYTKSITFADRVAIDDSGGRAKSITLSLRNTYDAFQGTGAGVETLLDDYLTLMPLLTRVVFMVTRSMSPQLYWKLKLGDQVFFTDKNARDPSTGKRGIVARPAIVIGHSFNLGGFDVGGKTGDMGGEVMLMFTVSATDRTGVAYVPSADIDMSFTGIGFFNGYNSTTNQIRCVAHGYSESGDVGDAERFIPGNVVIIIEIDPIDPDNPLQWKRAVTSQTGANITLATPALGSGGGESAYDSAKSYHVLLADYADAPSSIYTYQADDDDKLILDSVKPFLYGSTSTGTYTANGSPDNIALIPTSRAVDGSARDVAHETDLAKAVNNFIDYKSAIVQPMLFTSELSNGDPSTGTGYRVVAYWPTFLSWEILSNAVRRQIDGALWVRSSDGTSTQARLSLTQNRPSGSNFYTASSGPSGLTGTPFSSITFTGITSTTPYITTAQQLVANVKHPFTGQAYLVLELGYKCLSWGVARFMETARIIT